MQITLKQRDVELALKMYLSSQGIPLAGRSFDIDFTAGRKDTGLTVYVDIGSAEELAQSYVEAVKPVEPRPVEQKVMLDPEVEALIYDKPEAEAVPEVLLSPEKTQEVQALFQSKVVPPPIVEDAPTAEIKVQEDPEIPAPWTVDSSPEAIAEEEKTEEPVASAPAKISLFA